MLLRLLTSLVFALPSLILAAQPPTPRVIDADLSKPRGSMNRMYNFCVGAGRANEGLRADWQRQLGRARAECGFRYIRFHGLFGDDMGTDTTVVHRITCHLLRDIPLCGARETLVTY